MGLVDKLFEKQIAAQVKQQTKVIKAQSTRQVNKQVKEITAELKEQLSELTAIKSLNLSNPYLTTVFPDIFGTGAKKLTEPYKQVPIIYSAIKTKADSIAQVPILLKSVKGDTEIKSGPVYELFQYINPTLNKQQFIEAIVTNLDLKGQALIMLDDVEYKGVPFCLWVFNSDCWTPNYNQAGSYDFSWKLKRGNTEKIVPSERIIQTKYYNPFDEIEGLAPLTALQITNETEWNALKYNNKFFENDATPNTAFMAANNLSDPQYNRLKNALIDRRKGVDTAHDAILLDGGMDVKNIALTQRDMQFLEQRKFNREEILMTYKVPKSEVGLYEDLNYATAFVSSRQFWTRTLLPICTLIKAALDKWLIKYSIRMEWDFSKVYALTGLEGEKIDAFQKLWMTGQFGRNELNDRFNMGFEAVPWGDERYSPSVFPGDTSNQDNSDDQDDADDSKDDKQPPPKNQKEEIPREEIAKALRANLWLKLAEPLRRIEAKAVKDVRAYFHRIEKNLIDKVVKSQDWAPIMKRIEEVEVDPAFNDKKLAYILEVHIKAAMGYGISTIAGANFNMSNPRAVEALLQRVNKIKVINQTAREKIHKTIRDVLEQALQEGWTEDRKGEEIRKALKEDFTQLKSHARTIARTETHAAYADARYDAMESTDPKYKQWIDSRDDRVRDEHRLDGEVVKWGESFANGLQRPHDPRGSGSDVINCRCDMIPLYDESEAIR